MQRFEAAYSDDDKEQLRKKASNMSVLEEQAKQKKKHEFKVKKAPPSPKVLAMPIAKPTINQGSMHFSSIQKELETVKHQTKKLSKRFDQLQK